MTTKKSMVKKSMTASVVEKSQAIAEKEAKEAGEDIRHFYDAMKDLLDETWTLREIAQALFRVGMDRLADEITEAAVRIKAAQEAARTYAGKEANRQLQAGQRSMSEMLVFSLESAPILAQAEAYRAEHGLTREQFPDEVDEVHADCCAWPAGGRWCGYRYMECPQ